MENKEKKERQPLIDQLESEKVMDETVMDETASEEKIAVKETIVPQEPQIMDETGVISKGTKVIGNVVSKGHLVVYGEILGNIEALGDVDISGKVTGDISGNNIKLSNCNFKSNLTARGTVTIDGNSRVEGAIDCERITVDGTVEGNINATQQVGIFQNAKVIGDIKTKTFGVESGAQLQGNIAVVK